eukprot:8798238-Pyramimonas_sp.AAC.1
MRSSDLGSYFWPGRKIDERNCIARSGAGGEREASSQILRLEQDDQQYGRNRIVEHVAMFAVDARQPAGGGTSFAGDQVGAVAIRRRQ